MTPSVDAADVNIQLGSATGRFVVAWMLLAFIVTFLVTRLVTRTIRSGRGPFGNATVGGVHVHHQVYGIFLMLGAATGEFAYRPRPPWLQLLAVAFAAGAALTLDEFALWLHLDDVYWTQEGRKSVDAVLVACVIGGALMLGADPLASNAGKGAGAIVAALAFDLLCSLIAIVKGKKMLGVIGVFVPLVSLVAAVRLAKPTSLWARGTYSEESRRLARSRRRYQRARYPRLNAFKNFVAGSTEPDSGAAAVQPSAAEPTELAEPARGASARHSH